MSHFLTKYLKFIDQTNWHSEGISLVDTKNECKSDHLKIFNSNYDVVFVDVTGNVNLASILTLPKYMQVINLSVI